ncbi:hypothetical protein CUS_5072 [Ruminococcus albus 8]|uniref:Uncharacterized protein n=1 Tax=Ruminococcus albus 8 TaxID=246199 RepID=E9SDB9_RUMAL|nr:hypothetical protein CUS_5072 [Ruminococcus albus 8]
MINAYFWTFCELTARLSNRKWHIIGMQKEDGICKLFHTNVS